MFPRRKFLATASLSSLGCSRPDGSLKSSRARAETSSWWESVHFRSFFSCSRCWSRRVLRPNATTRIIVKRDPGLSSAEQRDIRADADVRLVDTLPPAAHRGRRPRRPTRRARAARAQPRPGRRLRRERPRRRVPASRTIQRSASSGACRTTGRTSDRDYAVVRRRHRRARGVGAVQSPAPGRHGRRRRHRRRCRPPGPRRDSVADALRLRRRATAYPGGDDENGHGTHVAGTIAAISEQQRRASSAWPRPRGSCRCGRWTRTARVRLRHRSRRSTYAGRTRRPDRQRCRSAASPTSAALSMTRSSAIPDALFVGGRPATDSPSTTPPQTFAFDGRATSRRNVICVGASTSCTTNRRRSPTGTRMSVDLFAPGEAIFSTIRRRGTSRLRLRILSRHVHGGAGTSPARAALVLSRLPHSRRGRQAACSRHRSRRPA